MILLRQGVSVILMLYDSPTSRRERDPHAV